MVFAICCGMARTLRGEERRRGGRFLPNHDGCCYGVSEFGMRAQFKNATRTCAEENVRRSRDRRVSYSAMASHTDVGFESQKESRKKSRSCLRIICVAALSRLLLDYLCASHEFRFCHRRRRHRIVVLLPSVFGSEATKSERANGRAKSSLPPSSSNSCIRFLRRRRRREQREENASSSIVVVVVTQR